VGLHTLKNVYVVQKLYDAPVSVTDLK